VQCCHGRGCERSVLSSGSQGGRLPAKQRSIVAKFNELPALPRISARAIVAGMVCARQQRPHNFETSKP
jgi:hypothetical protein